MSDTCELFSWLGVERNVMDVIGDTAKRYQQPGDVSIIAEAIWDWFAIRIPGQKILEINILKMTSFWSHFLPASYVKINTRACEC